MTSMIATQKGMIKWVVSQNDYEAARNFHARDGVKQSYNLDEQADRQPPTFANQLSRKRRLYNQKIRLSSRTSGQSIFKNFKYEIYKNPCKYIENDESYIIHGIIDLMAVCLIT